jgi:hypothetical protein
MVARSDLRLRFRSLSGRDWRPARPVFCPRLSRELLEQQDLGRSPPMQGQALALEQWRALGKAGPMLPCTVLDMAKTVSLTALRMR